jgi:hypothetical protein
MAAGIAEVLVSQDALVQSGLAMPSACASIEIRHQLSVHYTSFPSVHFLTDHLCMREFVVIVHHQTIK